ncbi:hypothetical protein SDC9_199400 [bioreactor metagenome]|uniref:Uncharacterized protein n=1 Tax=bioreactor metagenome TaxID=1076179 RepID=A0A645IKE8_9ZZZZ
MGVLQIFSAIKAIGCTEVSRFHFVENRLCIDQFEFIQIKIDSRTQKFFRQKWDVKTVGIESA